MTSNLSNKQTFYTSGFFFKNRGGQGSLGPFGRLPWLGLYPNFPSARVGPGVGEWVQWGWGPAGRIGPKSAELGHG